MNLRMRRFNSLATLTLPNCDVIISGDVVDARGAGASTYLTALSARQVKMTYDPLRFMVLIDKAEYNLEGEQLQSFFNDVILNRSIVLDATTLGFVELLVCLRFLSANKHKSTAILYLEPGGYASHPSDNVLDRRDFQLSQEFTGFKPIPGSVLMMREGVEACGVFFLGYEGQRLDQVLETFQMINTRSCFAVFGVPEYSPGWTMNAFANNIRILKERRTSVQFCAADNPRSAFERLEKIYQGLSSPQRMFIVPLGTKPHGIGVALFAALKGNVGILYDHPTRNRGRTDAVGKCHVYHLSFS